jgi:riboflavin kinase / FMN adenylyltransferase
MIRFDGDPASWEAGPSAVAIGVFDGVHLGHRSVLAALRGSGARPTVLTFAEHPAKLLRPGPSLPMLTTLDERIVLLGEAGIEAVAVVEFDAHFRDLSPEAFVARYLVAGLRSNMVAVGRGFRFGHGASGSVDTLRRLGAAAGFAVAEIHPVDHDGVEVRSSTIRGLLAAGDVAAAAELLGRPHRITGTVVPGDGRGRTIGVPTANLAMTEGIAVPGNGVYAVAVDVTGRSFHGVANLGVRPTFAAATPAVEVHLFDFDEDIYGEAVGVGFVARIRDEQRFESVEALVAQIRDDVAAGRHILARGS